jgi:uncharacterized protein (TIGR02679 family)
LSPAPLPGAGAEREELIRFLGRPGLRRLWQAARERLEALGGVRGSVRLAAAGDDERQALADLLGLPRLPRGELRVRLDQLDRALRESRFAVDLASALAALGGPLRDRTAERTREAHRREQLWDEAARHPAVGAWPLLAAWLAGLRASGLLPRLAAGGDERRLLGQALDVLGALATLAGNEGDVGGVRLPVLASGVLGASHALDPGGPAATLALSALAHRAERPPPRNAQERRQLWESAGVIADDLSCDVLTLRLAPLGGGGTGEGLRVLAAAGEPVWMTLRQLSAAGLAFPERLRVRVCENPVVVAAAADRWGPAGAPLVCVNGFANHAARTLLRHLARAGADLLYHGDFDWAGLRIANNLGESLPVRPWRFTAGDYRAALRAGGEPPRLQGPAVDASWDPELGRAMAEAGRAVEEEAVLADLLGDLAP